MSFQTLAFSDKTFNMVGPGRYMASTVTFGNPRDYIQVRGGTYNAKTGIVTASLSRNIEKLDTEGATEMLSLQVIIQVPHSFRTAEVDSALEDLSVLLNVPFLERLLQGEQ